MEIGQRKESGLIHNNGNSKEETLWTGKSEDKIERTALLNISNQISVELSESKKIFARDEVKNKKKFTSSKIKDPLKKQESSVLVDEKWFSSCENDIMEGNLKHKQIDLIICNQYSTEIYEYMYISEMEKGINSAYMTSKQTDVNARMRSVLVDWLAEVAQEYNLLPETLFLSVMYADRYLSKINIKRNRLQLIGITSLFIASKYEEIYAPHIDEFCYITDSTYTREEVLQMERQILDTLGFELTQPTVKAFLTRMLAETGATSEIQLLANFFAELTLPEYSFLCYRPSMIAASSTLLAFLTFDAFQQVSDSFVKCSNYTPSDLRTCVEMLNGVFASVESSPAIREKYAQQKFSSVALVSPLPELPFSLWE